MKYILTCDLVKKLEVIHWDENTTPTQKSRHRHRRLILLETDFMNSLIYHNYILLQEQTARYHGLGHETMVCSLSFYIHMLDYDFAPWCTQYFEGVIY